MTIFEVLLGLQVKHFLCDFPLQAFPYMYRNKGNVWHPGGYLHAGIHMAGTFLLFGILGYNGIALALFDFVSHYAIDYLKINTTKFFDLKPDNSEWFWIWLGFDQFCHQFVYITMTMWVLDNWFMIGRL